ncbi:PaaI family thioesterase [Vibrio nereis]|uniref:Acyl-coenzyme A thioesterase THEM4 n=1 Tax=Vibrio nereis TaxID=693 RepID=A0A0M0HJH9_VIBNE|nr:PaaI family thioesterase [Vibrio nereis]KOO02220.1 thioesterase [Vibrio nereis]
MNTCNDSHACCAVCSSVSENPFSLNVNYQANGEHECVSAFLVEERHQGYLGLLHGGIASSLLDGAMTHCLLQHGIMALTAKLDVRFHDVIKLGEKVDVKAICHSSRRSVYDLSAQLTVNGIVKVSATAKFIRPKNTVCF